MQDKINTISCLHRVYSSSTRVSHPYLKCNITPSLRAFPYITKLQFPPSSRVLFFLYKGVNGVYPKLDVPPLSLSGFSPTTQLGAILYKIIRRSRGRQSALA